MIPHVTEEIYQNLYADERTSKSIHRGQWPLVKKSEIDEESEKRGDLLIAIISEIRREKAEKHLPLNAPIRNLRIYALNDDVARTVDEGKEDIRGTCKVDGFQVLAEKGSGSEVKPFGISFVATYE
jgi:valyl-tRNA synthetase